VAVLAAVLVLAGVGIYGQVASFPFLDYDDDVYVTGNRALDGGVDARTLRWTLTGFHAGNWHPLTWLSHLADLRLFGADAGAHHAVNLGLHLAAALLMLSALRGATGRVWPAFMAAAVFALHPLQVETVAWISQRKGVLAAFLWFSAFLAYLRYVRRPSAGRYVVAVVAGLAGYLAKPTTVTLPLVLLVLDWWPLGRLGRQGPARLPGGGSGEGGGILARGTVLAEKVPFLLGGLLTAVLTYRAQAAGGALGLAEHVGFPARAANAAISLAVHLGRVLWPADLAFFYPHPGNRFSLAAAAVSALLILFLTGGALLLRRSSPHLAAGWFWSLATFAPTLGFIQAGSQALADRYAHLPLAGLMVALAWEGRRWIAGGASASVRPALAVILALGALASRQQAGYWSGNEALFRRALQVVPDNWLAHHSLGTTLARQGRLEEAVEHYRRTVELSPHYAKGRYNLGLALVNLGKVEEGAVQLEEARGLGGENPQVLVALASAAQRRGDAAGARRHMATAVRQGGGAPHLLVLEGNLLRDQGRDGEAAEAYRRAIAGDPRSAEALNGLGIILAAGGGTQEAAGCFRRAVEADGGHVGARVNLASLLAAQGRDGEALEFYRQALALDPGQPLAHNNLAVLLSSLGRDAEARRHLEEALRLEPGNRQAAANLEIILRGGRLNPRTGP
jgi:tetratricopeptide (TPR) repeat protein